MAHQINEMKLACFLHLQSYLCNTTLNYSNGGKPFVTLLDERGLKYHVVHPELEQLGEVRVQLHIFINMICLCVIKGEGKKTKKHLCSFPKMLETPLLIYE